MEGKEANHNQENDLNDDIDHAAKIVSKVIDEYDVIDDPSSDYTNKNDIERELDEHNKHENKISAPQPIPSLEPNSISTCVSNRNRLSSSDRSSSLTETTPHTVDYPRVNCREKIVSKLSLRNDAPITSPTSWTLVCTHLLF